MGKADTTTRIRRNLTRIFLITLRRAKLQEVKTLTLLDEPVTVYVFEKDTPMFAQATPFGTILWNTSRTAELSTNAKRLILRHECSHRDRNPIYKGLLLGMAICFAAGTTLLVTIGYQALIGTPMNLLTIPTIIGLGMMSLFLILFRVEETIADYHAVRELGEEKFLSAYDEINDTDEVSILTRAFTTTLYTKPEHTIQLKELLDKYKIHTGAA